MKRIKKTVSFALILSLVMCLWPNVALANDEAGTEPKIAGHTMYLAYNDTESVKKGGVEILCDGLNETIISDENGYFFLQTEESLEGINLVVSDTDEYVGDTQPASNEVILTLKERFTATREMFEELSWIPAPTENVEITVTAKERYRISLNREDGFQDSLKIPLSPDNENVSIYVKDEEGNVSKPFTGLIKIDRTAPSILDVNVESETAYLKSHGIYAKEDAEVLVTITFEEAESGLKKAVLYGSSGEVYPLVAGEEVEGKYIATYKIDTGDEDLEDILYVKVEDNVGNTSEGKLIRGTEPESTIVIDSNLPVVKALELNKSPNERGWYNSPVTITAKGMDANSGLSEIRFLINESEKETVTFSQRKLDEAVLSTTLEESGLKNVTAIFLDNSGNETRKSVDIKMDLNAPVITIEGSSGAVKNAEDVKVSVSEENYAEEGSYISVTIKRNGYESQELYEKLNSVTIPKEGFEEDGIYEVKVNAFDAAGNSAEEKTITFTVDKTAPNLIGKGFDKSPNENGWYKEPITFTYEVEDNLAGISSIKAFVNDREVETKGGKVNLGEDLINSLINDTGVYSIKVVAEDRAGNASEIQAEAKIDIVKPVLTLSGIEDGKSYSEAPVLKVLNNEKHFTENGASVIVAIKKDGVKTEKLYERVEELKISDFAEDGSYEITVNSVDAAGNIAEEKHVSFILDKEAPKLNSLGFDRKPNDNGWYDSPITFLYEVRDLTSGIAKIEAFINGKSVETKDGKVEISEGHIKELENEEGTYTVKVRVEDKAGNISEIEENAKIDIVKPVISLANIENGRNYQSAPDLDILNDEKHFIEEGAFITVRVERNGEETETVYKKQDSLSVNDFKKDGLYKVSVTSTDAAGNISETKSVSFVVDATTPIIKELGTNVEPNENGWFNKEVIFRFEPADETSGLSGVASTVNGKRVDIKENSISLNKSLIEEVINEHGTYTIEITAIDKAGNEKVYAKTLKIDLVNPMLSLSGITDGAFYKETPFLNIASNEKHPEKGSIAVLIERNGSLVSEEDYPGETNLTLNSFTKDGKYIVKVRAKDSAGNTATEKVVSFTVDGTAPVLSSNGEDITPNGNGWYNSPMVARFSASDVTSGLKSITASINEVSVPYENGNVYITEEVIRKAINNDGTYEVVVTGTDHSGNRSSISRIYKIDLDRPNITISGADVGASYQSVPPVSIYSDDRYAKDTDHIITVTLMRDGKLVSEVPYKGMSSLSLTQLREDGDYVVRVSAIDAAGNTATSKEISFTKDSTPPVISILGTEEGAYYPNGASIEIQIRERYSATSSADIVITRELNGVTNSIPVAFSFTGETSSLTRLFEDTGLYKIKVTSRDKAGNVAEEKTASFYVDMVAPKVEISGLDKDVYTYEDAVAPLITYEDDYLDKISYTLRKANQDWIDNVQVRDLGGRLIFSDFAKTRGNDGVYTLSVDVTDKAGNITTKEILFTVNRFGSYYKYDKAVNEINGKHVKTLEGDLVIYEYNVTELKESKLEIRLDGKLIDGKTQSSPGNKENGYNGTKHVFKKESFEKEGVYEINVLSTDASGNKMESQGENGVVKFIVDRTAPTITISGLERYMNASEVTAKIGIMDGLSLENSVTVYINGEVCEGIQREDGLEVNIQEGSNQEIKVVARDASGNESEETFTVSVIPSGLIYTLTKNLGLFITGGVGCALLLAGFIFLLKRRKKDKDNI